MFNLDDELQILKEAGLLWTVPRVEARSATRIRIYGCDLVLMVSNDYLGLSYYPLLISRGAQAAADQVLSP